MATMWNGNNSGIFIHDTSGTGGLYSVGEIHAFVSATRRALDKINSGPNGSKLLDLIGKRHAGVGTNLLNGTVSIGYGRGSLYPGEINPQAALNATAALPQNMGNAFRTNTPIGNIPRVTRAGAGCSVEIQYNPFINYSATCALGVETPGFIALVINDKYFFPSTTIKIPVPWPV